MLIGLILLSQALWMDFGWTARFLAGDVRGWQNAQTAFL
jgi:hypothetical protein